MTDEIPNTSTVTSAILVGIQLPQISTEELESSLEELARLVTTLGYKVVGTITQKRGSSRLAAVLGEGKLKELALITGGSGKVSSGVTHKLSKAALKRQQAQAEPAAAQADQAAQAGALPKVSADVVIVDAELSPSQIRNLESATGVTVLDRTGVIIEIFSRHARTKAARLQVEIARLNYVAPRLRETGGGEDRQGGGIGGKGAGETSLELDRRRIRDRIKELKNELASIGKDQETRRVRRQQELRVALVGYTNAGKSSLMRALTGSEVLVADKLFATLDTTVRPLYPETRPKVLLSDTVGFIKKLPHDLVASFKSTLDEALNASLLLFVVDASDTSFRSQLEVTKNVLAEVGASEVPSFLILNKCDRLDPAQLDSLKNEFPDAAFISTRSSESLRLVRERIMSYFESDMVDAEILVPFSAQGIVGEIRNQMRVLRESYDENGTTFLVRASMEKIQRINKKLS